MLLTDAFVFVWMNIAHWWIDMGKGESQSSEKMFIIFHLVHHKSHMVRPGIEPRPWQWEAEDWPPVQWDAIWSIDNIIK